MHLYDIGIVYKVNARLYWSLISLFKFSCERLCYIRPIKRFLVAAADDDDVGDDDFDIILLIIIKIN